MGFRGRVLAIGLVTSCKDTQRVLAGSVDSPLFCPAAMFFSPSLPMPCHLKAQQETTA